MQYLSSPSLGFIFGDDNMIMDFNCPKGDRDSEVPLFQFGTFGYMYPFTFSYFHLRNSNFTLSLWRVASIPKSVRGVAWYKRLKTPDIER